MSMKLLLAALLALVSLVPHRSDALSCFCGGFPCEVPSCCVSGRMSTDACGCCPSCAKAEEESCGGPWSINGLCSDDLNCLRTCDCKAEISDNDRIDCVFPFSFKGKVYNKCTKDHSDNGKAWCSYKVDSQGVAVNGAWGDCIDGCPGTEFQCGESDLFNFDGRCVNRTNYESTAANSPLVYTFDDNFGGSKPAPVCGKSTTNSKTCRCVQIKRNQNLIKGEGCLKPEHSGNGWCFLEYVKNPSNPSEDCYPDAQWSEMHSRFWSSEACEPQLIAVPEPMNGPPAPPPPGTKLIFPSGKNGK